MHTRVVSKAWFPISIFVRHYTGLCAILGTRPRFSNHLGARPFTTSKRQFSGAPKMRRGRLARVLDLILVLLSLVPVHANLAENCQIQTCTCCQLSMKQMGFNVLPCRLEGKLEGSLNVSNMTLMFHLGNFDGLEDDTAEQAAMEGRIFADNTGYVPTKYGTITATIKNDEAKTTYAWTPPSNGFANVLVVAGGGGGGGRSGGGGGAGGLLFLTGFAFSGTKHTIEVGNGGAGGAAGGSHGLNGTSSSVFGQIAIGGGGGGSDGAHQGLNGGSGGGGRYGGNGGNGVSCQGTNGGGSIGHVKSTTSYNGGGGGGAGEAGKSGNETAIGNGGDGLEVFGTYYAGGGGGGAHDPTPSGLRGLGGKGGGGDGGDRANLINGGAAGEDGEPHTGGGGGAGTTDSGVGGKGGKGGSGVVIISILD